MVEVKEPYKWFAYSILRQFERDNLVPPIQFELLELYCDLAEIALDRYIKHLVFIFGEEAVDDAIV